MTKPLDFVSVKGINKVLNAIFTTNLIVSVLLFGSALHGCTDTKKQDTKRLDADRR